jgi:hypothetical protein
VSRRASVASGSFISRRKYCSDVSRIVCDAASASSTISRRLVVFSPPIARAKRVTTLAGFPWPEIGKTAPTILGAPQLFWRWSYLNMLVGIFVLIINHCASVSHPKKSLSFTAMDLCRITRPLTAHDSRQRRKTSPRRRVTNAGGGVPIQSAGVRDFINLAKAAISWSLRTLPKGGM